MQQCDPAFRNMLEAARIPVVTSFLGKGSFSESSRVSLGTISRHLKDRLVEIFDRADCFLVCGYDYIEGISPAVFNGKKILYFDVIPSKSDRLLKPTIEVVGDI